MFKAEVLQDYSGVDDGPSLRAWLQGDKQRAVELYTVDKEAASFRKMCLQSPARIQRVHVVEYPLTPYLEWEINIIYKQIVQTGAEGVYLVDSRDVSAITLPAGDFWIFDNTQVLQWEYDDVAGAIKGGATYDTSEITPFIQLQEKLLEHAKKI